jgi:hypothetical protein
VLHQVGVLFDLYYYDARKHKSKIESHPCCVSRITKYLICIDTQSERNT